MNRTIKTLAGAAVLVSAVSLVPAFSVSALTLSTDTGYEATGAAVTLDGTEYKIAGLTLAEGATISTSVSTYGPGYKKLNIEITGNATIANVDLSEAFTADQEYKSAGISVVAGSTLTIKDNVAGTGNITNNGTLIIDGAVSLGMSGPTRNLGTIIVTKNGNLTINGGTNISGSVTINAVVASDGTLTSGKVTKGATNATITAGTVTGDVANFFTGDLSVVDNDGVSSLDGTRINHVLSVNGSSATISVTNASTTFGDIKADLISAIETTDNKKVGLLYLDGDSDKNTVPDDTPISGNMTFAYDVFAATVVVTDTTGATSNVRSLEVTEEGKTIQDILTANSITISDEYGFYTTADGSAEIDLTDTIAHGANIEVFIVAKPDEAPEIPASINATLYFINGTDDVISGVSFGTNYYVTTPGVLSSILSEKGISLAGRYALFIRNSDGTFTKVNLDSESIATDGSCTYYVGLEDGTVLTDSYYIYVSNKTWEEIEGFGDYDYVSRSTKNKNLSVADLINKYGKIFDSTKHSIFACDYKTKKYVKIDGAMSISELYAKYSNDDVILAKKDSKTAGALVSIATLNTADVDLKDVLNDEVLNNKANGFTKDEIKEIKDAVENDAAEIYASAYQFTPTAADKKKIEEAAKKEGIDLDNIIGYLDVNVTVWTGENSYEIHETGEELEFSARINTKNLPEVAKGKTRAYYVIRNHNGEISFIKATMAKDGKTLRFKSDKFSTYAVAYVDLADIVLAGATTNKTPDTAGFINNEKSVQSTSLISVITAGVTALGAVIAKLFKKSER